MNKKIIWTIIGLMTAALIGIIVLQYNQISFTIRLNEGQFNASVKNALARVVNRLDLEDQRNSVSIFKNGYMQSYFQDMINREPFVTIPEIEATTEEVYVNGNKLSERQIIKAIMSKNNDCNCENCQRERSMELQEYLNMTSLDFLPLDDRIDIEKIDRIISEEFGEQGINTEYKYSVYSRIDRAFVIANNKYLVTDDNPTITIEGYENLKYSKYKANLFPTDEKGSPGYLSVYFPKKNSFVFSEVRNQLIGAIIFTGIILFCFAYTINVIFLQKKLSEMKTDFINNMTHEFKTPIATISLAADSIGNPRISGNPDKVARFANIIKQENRRMNSQVEKVLQMAMLDKQNFSLKLTEVDLHEVINNAINNISLSVEKRNGKAWAELNAQRSIVNGDLTHISNIINNLLDNANKYSPDEPAISIHTRNVKHGVEVIVKDQGMGMDKEARKHIFDKFYRVHTGDVHDVKGHGLGLSYVKAMMTAHKGQIDVKSELGKGSSFILMFPYQVEHKVMH